MSYAHGHPSPVALAGGTRSAMRASIRRSASTSAAAQSRSIVVVAGRMVRVSRQASTEPADQVLVRLRLFRFFSEPLDEFTRRAAREGPEADRRRKFGKSARSSPSRSSWRPMKSDGRRHELARSQQAARVAEHAQLQREASLLREPRSAAPAAPPCWWRPPAGSSSAPTRRRSKQPSCVLPARPMAVRRQKRTEKRFSGCWRDGEDRRTAGRTRPIGCHPGHLR